MLLHKVTYYCISLQIKKYARDSNTLLGLPTRARVRCYRQLQLRVGPQHGLKLVALEGRLGADPVLLVPGRLVLPCVVHQLARRPELCIPHDAQSAVLRAEAGFARLRLHSHE